MFLCEADSSSETSLKWRIKNRTDIEDVLFTSSDRVGTVHNFSAHGGVIVNLTRTRANMTSTLTINNASEFRNLNIECIPDSGQTSTYTLFLFGK